MDETTLSVKAKTVEALEIKVFIDTTSCIQSFKEWNLKTNHSKLKLSNLNWDLNIPIIIQQITGTT